MDMRDTQKRKHTDIDGPSSLDRQLPRLWGEAVGEEEGFSWRTHALYFGFVLISDSWKDCGVRRATPPAEMLHTINV